METFLWIIGGVIATIVVLWLVIVILIGVIQFLSNVPPAVYFVAIVGALWFVDFSGDKYQLEKYYRGGSFAGVVATFNGLGNCLDEKRDAERDDRHAGHDKAKFMCVKN